VFLVPTHWNPGCGSQGENNLAEDELLVRFMEVLEERGQSHGGYPKWMIYYGKSHENMDGNWG
jgi:hypothetical protein